MNTSPKLALDSTRKQSGGGDILSRQKSFEELRQILQTVALLWQYPDDSVYANASKCKQSFDTGSTTIQEHFSKFENAISSRSLFQLQELYTRTFDLQVICYPYVGYHLFGESYKRGAFMAQLKERFQRYHFDQGRELPDHVGVLLRFLSDLPDQQEFLTIVQDGLIPALQKMQNAFSDEQNPYANLISTSLILLQDLVNKDAEKFQ